MTRESEFLFLLARQTSQVRIPSKILITKATKNDLEECKTNLQFQEIDILCYVKKEGKGLVFTR